MPGLATTLAGSWVRTALADAAIRAFLSIVSRGIVSLIVLTAKRISAGGERPAGPRMRRTSTRRESFYDDVSSSFCSTE